MATSSNNNQNCSILMLLYYNMMRNILHLEISLNTIKIAQYLIVIHYINEMRYICILILKMMGHMPTIKYDVLFYHNGFIANRYLLIAETIFFEYSSK